MGSCGSAGAEKTGAAAALVSLGDVGPAQTMNGEQGWIAPSKGRLLFSAHSVIYTSLFWHKTTRFESKLTAPQPLSSLVLSESSETTAHVLLLRFP